MRGMTLALALHHEGDNDCPLFVERRLSPKLCDRTHRSAEGGRRERFVDRAIVTNGAAKQKDKWEQVDVGSSQLGWARSSRHVESRYRISILFAIAIAAWIPFFARTAFTCAFCLGFRFRR